MSYRVQTDSFEGPFDLLLYLVSRQKVAIGSISIARIADQYLEEVSRMERLDLETASDFLLVASTLLEIKAASLLPDERDQDSHELEHISPHEARDILITRLLTYKQYKNAAQALEQAGERASRHHPRLYGPGKEFLDILPDFLRSTTIEEMAYIAAMACARRERFLLESEHIAAKPIPIEVYVGVIHEKLKTAQHMRFSELIDNTTPAALVVVQFLALLELFKRRLVDLEQEGQFGDISISLRPDA